MKQSLLICIVCLIGFTGSAQVEKDAELSKIVLGTQVQFTFISNRTIDEFNEQRWEQRFPNLESALISIDIVPETQEVILIMDENYSEEALFNLVKRFDFTSLTITE